MLAVIPIVAVLKDILDHIVAHYERKKFGQLIDEPGLQEQNTDEVSDHEPTE